MNKKHILSSGKEIHIYDGIFDSATRSEFFIYAQNSRYSLGWNDSDIEQASKHKLFHCILTEQEAIESKVYPRFTKSEGFKHVCHLNFIRSIINLSTPSDTNFPHTHPDNQIVALYYANINWEPHWHGETLFYSEDHSEIELAVRYTPGRLVIFEGSVPHSIRPQSSSADNFRFTYAMMFGINNQ